MYVLPLIITALREAASMNQSELAAALDVSPSAANQVENPEHPVQEAVFIRYAKACGFPDELEAIAKGISLLRRKARAEAKRAPAPRRRTAKKAAARAR